MKKISHYWPIVIILLVASGIRLWGINHQIYTDENKVISPSVTLAQGKQTPLLYPKGSYYPHLYHYVLGLTFLPLAIVDTPYPSTDTTPDTYTIVARVVTALLGALTVSVVYSIGSHIGDKRLGIMAALLLTFLPFHVKYSHYAHVDIPLTFTVALAIWAAIRLWETGQTKWYVITGIFVGMSGAIHYTGLSIGIVLLIAHVARIRIGGTYNLKTILSRSFIIGLLCIPLAFAISTPYTILKWRESLEIYHQLNLRGAAGDLGYTRPNLLWPIYTDSPDWGLPFTQSGLLAECGPILLALAVGGVIVAFYKRAFLPAVLLGATTIILYIVIVGKLPLYAIKRLLPLAPFFCLLAAYALLHLWNTHKKVGAAIAIVVLAGITAANAWHSIRFSHSYASGLSTHSQAILWAESNIPHGSTVLQHTPIKLIDWQNKNYNTIRLDEVYASFNKQDPEVSHDRAKPIEYWTKEKGTEYIAMDGRIVDRYYDKTSMKLYPETTASYQAFYNDIRSRGKLIYNIHPQLGKNAGPWVEIYDVRGL